MDVPGSLPHQAHSVFILFGFKANTCTDAYTHTYNHVYTCTLQVGLFPATAVFGKKQNPAQSFTSRALVGPYTPIVIKAPNDQEENSLGTSTHLGRPGQRRLVSRLLGCRAGPVLRHMSIIASHTPSSTLPHRGGHHHLRHIWSHEFSLAWRRIGSSPGHLVPSSIQPVEGMLLP